MNNTIREIFSSDKAITPADFIKNHTNVKYEDSMNINTCEKLREWLDTNGFENYWDFPISEIDEIIEHKWPVVLVVDNIEGINCRYFEIIK